jgi:hypothetical protein
MLVIRSRSTLFPTSYSPFSQSLQCTHSSHLFLHMHPPQAHLFHSLPGHLTLNLELSSHTVRSRDSSHAARSRDFTALSETYKNLSQSTSVCSCFTFPTSTSPIHLPLLTTSLTSSTYIVQAYTATISGTPHRRLLHTQRYHGTFACFPAAAGKAGARW